jgi:hypothetical protein
MEDIKPLIVDFESIVGVYMACVPEGNKVTNFLNFTCRTEKGDIYTIAVPHVFVKQHKKEELADGEGRVRRAGLQKAPEGETSRSEEQEDQAGSESEDTGAEA